MVFVESRSAQAGGGRAGTGALLRAVEWMLLMRRAPTTLRKVAAHGGHACNDTADALAALGAAGKGDFGGQVCGSSHNASSDDSLLSEL
jgi:hypothetical protein